MTVKVFALSTCPHCKRARAFLTEHGIAYDVSEVDLMTGAERDAAIDEVQTLSGGTSFPVIVIDGQVVVGFNQARLEELLGL